MVGGVSDSDFNQREGYLEEQRLFQEIGILLVDRHETIISSLNIYDKGSHTKMVAWQICRQLVLQPDFKKSDKILIGVNLFHQSLSPLIVGVMREW
jgi:hypothetical protein